MHFNNFDWMERIKAIEREFLAMRFAASRLVSDVQTGLAKLPGIEARDLHQASAMLEGTYLIRLFAEFETGLRSYWRVTRKKDPPARTRDLIDAIGAKRRVATQRILAAHEVREYRNALVHERQDSAIAVELANARRQLCRFLSHLPGSK